MHMHRSLTHVSIHRQVKDWVQKWCESHLVMCQSHILGLSYLSTINDWDLLHQRHFCVVFARLLSPAGISNENEFHTSSSPTLCESNDVTFVHAHSLCSEVWLL